MKKLILVQWDIQMGPHPLVQYPPEAEFPPKDLLLKIWARHETATNTKFIEMLEGSTYYCSLLKKIDNRTYFIILEVAGPQDLGIFREILENVADNLIKNLNIPQFPYILSETFKTIKNYSDMDDQQLLLRLFEDRIRIDILQILRSGVLTKKQLYMDLQRQFGYVNVNLDLFLTPFVRLDLIRIENAPGGEESIYLLQDVYACLLPATKQGLPPPLVQELQNLFNIPQILEDTTIHKMNQTLLIPATQKFLRKLRKLTPQCMTKADAVKLIENQSGILDHLKNYKIITEFDNLIYLLTDLVFIKFEPRYLIPNLVERYTKGQISLDQLKAHLVMLE